MKKYSNIFYIVGSYISVLLGAGFISGQELLFFFGQHGNIGFLGLYISCLLFSLLGYKQLKIVKYERIFNYNDFTKKVMGNFLAHISENMSLLFVLVLMSTMFSAGGATINEAFGIGYNNGVVLVGFVVLLALMMGVKGIVFINGILAPLMLVGGILVGLYTYSYEFVPVINLDNIISTDRVGVLYIMLSGLIYMSYNSITSISLMSNMYDYIDSEETIFYSNLISGILMVMIGTALLLPIVKHHTSIEHLQIPILGLLKIDSVVIKYIYLFVLIAAIFTTAISCGISILNTIFENIEVNKFFFKIFLVVLTIILSKIGFSNFVSKVYPLFGFFGLIQIFKIFFYNYKHE